MALQNTQASYGWPAKALHWGMALLLISLVALGLYMSDLPRGEGKSTLIRLHASSGLLALMLLTMRFGWKLVNVSPEPMSKVKWQAHFSQLVHFSLYAIVAVQVVTGAMSLMTVGWDLPFYDLFSISTPFERDIERHHFWEELHELSWNGFAILMLMHLAATLYHQFIKKVNVLKRII